MSAALGYGVVGAALFVAVSLVYSHVALRRPAPVPHLLGIWLGLGLTLSIVVGAIEGRHTLALVVTNLAVYMALAEAYLFVYAAAVGSLSIQILVALREFEDSSDGFERALARHPPEAFFGIRLKSMCAQGLLSHRDGRFRLTNQGRRWAQAGRWLKRVLAVGAGG